ncbi:MAG: 2-oxoacid:acceptor oxidoreductase family protein [Candidatus Methanomethylicia archaeon]|nr:2-oxoacid:acceptor oxidoreductase family protein [Candidatus Methanomethylicia archaeon]MCX8169028.1 2-oxoacid:acceptor oxidoreductase family protein [Candidatus Methanomethylicia archaeon]MDW7988760.1 2-oxoacid:acceptor oxidoreductase family protein [Nitrososphaerota archaeon]
MMKIRICGFGGQGILLMGEILGAAAVIDGKNASEVGSYGAEVRGTTTVSDVIISEKKINYPLIDKCDILIAMSQQALNSNIHIVKENGVIIIDEDLVKVPEEFKGRVMKIKATKIAEEKYDKIVANMIILGYLVSKTKIVTPEALKNAVKERIRRMIDINLKAIDEGMKIGIYEG